MQVQNTIILKNLASLTVLRSTAKCHFKNKYKNDSLSTSNFRYLTVMQMDTEITAVTEQNIPIDIIQHTVIIKQNEFSRNG